MRVRYSGTLRTGLVRKSLPDGVSIATILESGNKHNGCPLYMYAKVGSRGDIGHEPCASEHDY